MRHGRKWEKIGWHVIYIIDVKPIPIATKNVSYEYDVHYYTTPVAPAAVKFSKFILYGETMAGLVWDESGVEGLVTWQWEKLKFRGCQRMWNEGCSFNPSAMGFASSLRFGPPSLRVLFIHYTCVMRTLHIFCYEFLSCFVACCWCDSRCQIPGVLLQNGFSLLLLKELRRKNHCI